MSKRAAGSMVVFVNGYIEANIEFTSDEYRVLQEVFQAADWVFNSHKMEDDPRTHKYRVLE